MSRFISYIIFSLIFMTVLSGCHMTPEQKVMFDPEKAAIARLKLGLGYLAQVDESEENIKRAHYNLSLANSYSPNNPNIMLGMAMFDQKVGEYQEAEMIYKAITKMVPDDGLYLLHYGTFLCATDRYQDAKEQFNKVLALYSPQWKLDGLEQLGICAIQNSDTVQADDAFSKLFEYDVNKRKRINKLAEIYRQKGDTRVADYLTKITQ